LFLVRLLREGREPLDAAMMAMRYGVKFVGREDARTRRDGGRELEHCCDIVRWAQTLENPQCDIAADSIPILMPAAAPATAAPAAAPPNVSAHQAIEEAYWSHGGPHGTLGHPVGDEQPIGDSAGGYFRDYRSIVRGAPMGVSPVREGHLNDRATCHDPDAGAPMTLDSAIYWTPRTGVCVVEGEILALWRQMGAEKSALGYPVADETNTPEALGRVSRFEHGDIVWRPDTGPAVEMPNAAGAP
jgi:hypothetical protein